ncbi:hypothetical protein SD81_016605 [Tolypothrix campylonemoides VB511288]|nr:hypothetical protein SD81_016605 [Tolypothrix campylonemoides VB511288]
MPTAALAILLVLAHGRVWADTREATIDFTNRAGQAERWQLRETVTGGAADRRVRREFARAGRPFYVETSRTVDGRLATLVVEDARPGGESMRVDVRGREILFVPRGAGDTARSETVDSEVLSLGQVAPRLADLLRSRPQLREHRFHVPIPKALKSAPMRARIVSVGPSSFDVELDSTSLVVRRFFMRDVFRMTVDRASGRLLRYAGQPEPYDLSAGRARSLWTVHTYAASTRDAAPASEAP